MIRFFRHGGNSATRTAPFRSRVAPIRGARNTVPSLAQIERWVQAFVEAEQNSDRPISLFSTLVGFPVLGHGGTRVVFELPGGKYVLKLPNMVQDQKVNQIEAHTWRTAPDRLRAWLVPVRRADPKGRWLVMDRVRNHREVEVRPRLTPKAEFDLQEAGIQDLRPPNVSADGRLLDYGERVERLWRLCKVRSRP